MHFHLRVYEIAVEWSQLSAILFLSSVYAFVVVLSVVVLEESPCPRESSKTNLQVLVLVLGHQIP